MNKLFKALLEGELKETGDTLKEMVNENGFEISGRLKINGLEKDFYFSLGKSKLSQTETEEENIENDVSKVKNKVVGNSLDFQERDYKGQKVKIPTECFGMDCEEFNALRDEGLYAIYKDGAFFIGRKEDLAFLPFEESSPDIMPLKVNFTNQSRKNVFVHAPENFLFDGHEISFVSPFNKEEQANEAEELIENEGDAVESVGSEESSLAEEELECEAENQSMDAILMSEVEFVQDRRGRFLKIPYNLIKDEENRRLIENKEPVWVVFFKNGELVFIFPEESEEGIPVVFGFTNQTRKTVKGKIG